LWICILSRFLETLGQFSLPIWIHDGVIEGLVHLNHLRLPLVKVDRLDFRNMHLQLPVLAWAPKTHKGTEGDWGPPWSLWVAIGALSVVSLFEESL
jgi:hypothetical protein